MDMPNTVESHDAKRLNRKHLLEMLEAAAAPITIDDLALKFWGTHRPTTWRASLHNMIGALNREGAGIKVKRAAFVYR